MTEHNDQYYWQAALLKWPNEVTWEQFQRIAMRDLVENWRSETYDYMYIGAGALKACCKAPEEITEVINIVQQSVKNIAQVHEDMIGILNADTDRSTEFDIQIDATYLATLALLAKKLQS